VTPRWRQVVDVVQGALDRPAAERAAWIAEACGADLELRREVESLVAAHDRAAGFLEVAADGPTWSMQRDDDIAGQRAWTLTPGSRLDRFDIEARIGAGGMGEVYRARDTRLARTVAIKLLRVMATETAAARLLREAQHASALNHPNICTIHEVGEADGRPFIVMEYVEGRSLSALVADNALPSGQLLHYATQIADAVAHAHAHGIVHRDLKASNVVVTADGRAKVLDFGLARRFVEQAATAGAIGSLTRPGTIAGTIACMAPELLRGEPADVRSDVWALGVLIYEMAAGAAPFPGDTDFEVAARILQERPGPLPDATPAGIAAIIHRCLLKEPNARYQSAAEVGASIAALAVTAAPGRILPARRRRAARLTAVAGLVAAGAAIAFLNLRAPGQGARAIAVLPFASTGSSPEIEYLGDGLTEGVINTLAQVPQSPVKVIALNSVLRYKGREIDPQAVGRDLHVAAIVIGRVVQRVDALRVSAELVDASDRSRMWGQTFDAGIGEFPNMQGEIAARIAENLQLRLTGDQRRRLTRRYTDNTEAYQLYVKGRYFWNKYTDEGWTKSIEYFNQAIELDPTYALAWAGVADSYYQLSSLVLLPAEAIPKARAAATRALALDDNLAEAHASLGIIKAQYDWDRPGAAKEFARAIELNPNYAPARQWYGMYLFEAGRFDEALTELTYAQQLDPFSLYIAVTAVWPLVSTGRYREAIASLEKTMEMHPESADLAGYLHDLRGDMYLHDRRPDDAVVEYLAGWRTKTLTSDSAETADALRGAYRAGGLTGFWRTQLRLADARYLEERQRAKTQPSPRYVSPFPLAQLLAHLGENDRAMALLEECRRNRDENLVWLKAESLRADSLWGKLPSDVRFIDLIRRLGLGP